MHLGRALTGDDPLPLAPRRVLPDYSAGPASRLFGRRVRELLRCDACKGTGRLIDGRWQCQACDGRGWR